MKILVARLLLLACMEMVAFATERKAYIVHMDREKLHKSYGIMQTSRELHQAVLESVHQPSTSQLEDEESEKDPPQLLHSYEKAMSGFAAKLSTHQLERLKKVDGFLAAAPDQFSTIFTTHTPRFLGLQIGQGLWQASNLKNDLIIGVVDSGIWPDHPSFRDTGLPPVPSRWRGTCQKGMGFSPEKHCNRKIIGARFFYQGYEAENGPLNGTGEYISARDYNGHGTHTASTAAGSVVGDASFLGFANGSAVGMMYTARIAIYKACWVLGRCSDADIAAAIEHAIQDGVDVLSLSLGSRTFHYYLEQTAVPFLSAINHGIFVSTAAGNDGPDPGTLSNALPWILTVAAGSVDRSFPATVKLGNGKAFRGQSLYSGTRTAEHQLVYGRSAGGKNAEFCDPGSLDPKLVKGKIVLCEIGNHQSMLIRSWVVMLAGGAGAIIINEKEVGEEVDARPHPIPTAGLGYSDGRAIKSYINSTKSPTASISFEGTTYGNRAPIIGGFSSQGPDAINPYVLKPDITTPGVGILAAYPITAELDELEEDKRKANYNIISGTSMACPHATGIAALVKSVHRDWSPAAIKSALMTTAYVTDNKGGPILDAFHHPATAFVMGSGHVDPNRAADPGLIYDIAPVDYLYFLCSLDYDIVQMAIFTRVIDPAFSCDGYEKVMAHPGNLNLPTFSLFVEDGPKSKSKFRVIYKRTVTNVGTPASSYAVQVEEPAGVSVFVQPKVLNFSKAGEKLSYRVTFTGKRTAGDPSFGSLTWVSKKHRVLEVQLLYYLASCPILSVSTFYYLFSMLDRAVIIRREKLMR